jgi:hypothetical protein
VRSIYAACERGDYSSTEWADPEIEMVSIGELFSGSATGVGLLSVKGQTYDERIP